MKNQLKHIIGPKLDNVTPQFYFWLSYETFNDGMMEHTQYNIKKLKEYITYDKEVLDLDYAQLTSTEYNQALTTANEIKGGNV